MKERKEEEWERRVNGVTYMVLINLFLKCAVVRVRTIDKLTPSTELTQSTYSPILQVTETKYKTILFFHFSMNTSHDLSIKMTENIDH